MYENMEYSRCQIFIFLFFTIMWRKTYFLNELGQQQTLSNTHFHSLKFISTPLNLCESIEFNERFYASTPFFF